jgi:hypothetical protein
MSTHENPVFVINNNDLPDYNTIIKDKSFKDTNPPTYQAVAANPTDFGIQVRVPSAPPQYDSRPVPLETSDAHVPIRGS